MPNGLESSDGASQGDSAKRRISGRFIASLILQNGASRTSSSEVPRHLAGHQLRPAALETSKDRSPKVIERRSPRSPVPESSGMNFGQSSGSTSSVDLQQKVVNMESQLQALIAYISAKEGGKIPEELAGLFPNSTQQPSDIGSGASSPNNIRRSSGGSNTHLADHQSPSNGI